MKKVAVIIVAGGIGARMGAQIPKQFLEINSRAILIHTIEAFAACLPSARIIVALPSEHIAQWKQICAKSGFEIEHAVCEGGATRFESVGNALRLVSDSDFVAIHDGVRPLVTQQVITSALELAAANGSAVPVVKATSSLRRVDESGASHVVDRAEYREVQTPQIFSTELIQRAYEQPYRDIFTDDASVVEALGVEVCLSQGDYSNIKITSPVDLATAEAIISSRRG